MILPVERPRHCRVRFAAPNGEVFTKMFSNMSARVWQHEYAHIQGRPFWDGISKLKFDIGVRKAKKKGFNYTGLSYKGI